MCMSLEYDPLNIAVLALHLTALEMRADAPLCARVLQQWVQGQAGSSGTGIEVELLVRCHKQKVHVLFTRCEYAWITVL